MEAQTNVAGMSTFPPPTITPVAQTLQLPAPCPHCQSRSGYAVRTSLVTYHTTKRSEALLVCGILGLLLLVVPGVIMLIIWAAYAKQEEHSHYQTQYYCTTCQGPVVFS